MKDSMILTDWMSLPSGMETPGSLFVLGDVHGNASLLVPLLQWIGSEADKNKEDGELVFLGDLIDRGPEGFRCLRLASRAIPGLRTTILPGNHEIAMMRFLSGASGAWQTWLSKGAASMIAEVHDLRQPVTGSDLRRRLRASMPSGFEKKLRAGPTHKRHGSFLMLHAGVDPTSSNPIEWLRTGLFEGDPASHWSTISAGFDSWTGGWENFGAAAIVHGHMPIMAPGWTEAIRTAHERLFSHRRLSLDFGCGFLDRLGGAQIQGRRIRYFGCGAGERLSPKELPAPQLLAEPFQLRGAIRHKDRVLQSCASAI